MMSAHLFPQTSGQTPWRTAILSLVPLAFAGPLAVVHSYHPWWDPQPLPFFRPFYTNIRRDWTLLSYGLYAFTLFTLIAHDQDMFPRLNLLVLLPSLIGILGALAHLRLSSALSRTAVLILGALAGVPLTMFTLYGSWMELLKAAGFVLAVWGVLVGLLLAPILAGIFARSEPFS